MRILENRKNPKKIYIRFFIILVISIVLTILIVSTILYFNFEKSLMSQISNSSMENLQKAGYSANLMIDWAKMLTIQIYQDRDIRAVLYSNSNEVTQNIARMRLKAYKASAPFLHSIYIYNGPTQTVFYDSSSKFSYDKNDFFDKEIIRLIEDEQKANHLLPIPRRIKIDSLNFSLYYNIYSYILYENPSVHIKGDNVIVLNISEDWLRNTIKSLDSNIQGNTFIIDTAGKMVISNNENEILTDISYQSYIKKIMESQQKTGFFKDDCNGVPSLITYHTSQNDKLDWIYISIIQYDAVTEKIKSMRNITLTIGTIILLLGLFASYIASKNIYKPIRDIIKKLQRLELENDQNIPSLKQEFLRSLIRSTKLFEHEVIDDSFKKLKVDLDIYGRYSIVIFKVDHYMDFCNKYNYNERKLLKSAMMRHICDVAAKSYKNECVDMENDTLVMILNNIEEPENEKKTIEKLAFDIQESIEKHFDISLTVVINVYPNSTIKSIARLYNEAMESSSYRVFRGHGTIIHCDMNIKKKSSQYIYPNQKEKLLIDALILRKEEIVMNLYEEIIMGTVEYSHNSLNYAVLRLILAISAATENIEKNIGNIFNCNYDEFIVKLNGLETINEINSEFKTLLRNIISSLNTKSNLTHEEIAGDIITTINENYRDPNISIQVLADEYYMSPVYLGRFFKKITSKSIAEYITNIRLDKAKELLITTRKTVNEIAVDVGFSSNNYFYTNFRKHYGITPTEYRRRFSK